MISLWENIPEQLTERSAKYTNRAMQAIQDPTGRENIKNIYFGIIMGVSAALPAYLFSFLSFLFLGFSKVEEKISFSQKRRF